MGTWCSSIVLQGSVALTQEKGVSKVLGLAGMTSRNPASLSWYFMSSDDATTGCQGITTKILVDKRLSGGYLTYLQYTY
jgi:hypothetical protein